MSKTFTMDPLHMASPIRTAWRSPRLAGDVCAADNHLDASLGPV